MHLKLWVWVFLFWLGLGPIAAAAAPRLEISQPVFDLGEVFEDQKLEHTFVLQNLGDQPLVIDKIELDCACSLVEFDSQIPPGGSGKVTFLIKPYSVIHKFCKKGEIFTNDPRQQVAEIKLCGLAKPFIEIKPSHIIRFTGNPNDNLTARIRLVNHQATPLTLKGTKTDLGDKVAVTLKTIEPGRVFELEVSNKVESPETYKGMIEVFTSSDKRPRLIFRVFADLAPNSVSIP